MNKYTLRYQDQFGIIHTSEYPNAGQYEFWRDIRKAQGYKVLIDTQTEFGEIKDEPMTNDSVIL